MTQQLKITQINTLKNRLYREFGIEDNPYSRDNDLTNFKKELKKYKPSCVKLENLEEIFQEIKAGKLVFRHLLDSEKADTTISYKFLEKLIYKKDLVKISKLIDDFEKKETAKTKIKNDIQNIIDEAMLGGAVDVATIISSLKAKFESYLK